MRVLLIGGGKMGRTLAELIDTSADLEIFGVVDEFCADTLAHLGAADVAIDFTAPAALEAVKTYVERTGTPLVSGTTGYTAAQLDELRALGKTAPVLHSANYSLGIAVMRRILPIMKTALGDGFDIELSETHHNQKVDAPSGTAKLLLESLDPTGEYALSIGRSAKRGSREIGVHSLRGGTVAGDHTVSFMGPDEVISVTHSAASRRIFAEGALQAARILAAKPAAFYTLEEILFGGGNA